LNFISYAQNFEDVMLWRALKQVEHGFYVDIGAQDPVQDSVSLAFFERGWHGVHVEPSVFYANRLREGRPGDEVLQVMVSDTMGVLPFHDFADTGLSTADSRIAHRHREAGYMGDEVVCPSVTLDSILGRYPDREIHWLKIDVEGSEFKVLSGWTLGRPLPWIVVVESTLPLTREESHADWEPFLVERGYEFAWFDGLNRFYVSPQHKLLKKAFLEPPNVFDGFELSGTASSSFAVKLNDDLRAVRQELKISAKDLTSARAQVEDIARQLAQETEIERRLLEQSSRDRAALVTPADEREQSRKIQNALFETTSALQSAHHELASERRRNSQDLSAIRRELATSEARATQLRTELMVAIADFEAIEHSRSWRITLPMRLAWRSVRRAAHHVKDIFLASFRLPRRVARRALLPALAHIRSNPARKQQIARALHHNAWLDARLRHFALGNPANGESNASRPTSHAAASPPSRLGIGAMSGAHAARVAESQRDAASRWPLGQRRNVSR
jgi:FkbM family methyltransferase